MKEMESNNDMGYEDDWPVIKTCRKDFSKSSKKFTPLKKKSEILDCIDLTDDDYTEGQAINPALADVNADITVLKAETDEIQTSFSSPAGGRNDSFFTKQSSEAYMQTPISTDAISDQSITSTTYRTNTQVSSNTTQSPVPLFISAFQSGSENSVSKSVSRTTQKVISRAQGQQHIRNSKSPHQVHSSLNLGTSELAYQSTNSLRSDFSELRTSSEVNVPERPNTILQRSDHLSHSQKSQTATPLNTSQRSRMSMPYIFLAAPASAPLLKESYSVAGSQEMDYYTSNTKTAPDSPNVLLVRPISNTSGMMPFMQHHVEAEMLDLVGSRNPVVISPAQEAAMGNSQGVTNNIPTFGNHPQNCTVRGYPVTGLSVYFSNGATLTTQTIPKQVSNTTVTSSMTLSTLTSNTNNSYSAYNISTSLSTANNRLSTSLPKVNNCVPIFCSKENSCLQTRLPTQARCVNSLPKLLPKGDNSLLKSCSTYSGILTLDNYPHNYRFTGYPNNGLPVYFSNGATVTTQPMPTHASNICTTVSSRPSKTLATPISNTDNNYSAYNTPAAVPAANNAISASLPKENNCVPIFISKENIHSPPSLPLQAKKVNKMPKLLPKGDNTLSKSNSNCSGIGTGQVVNLSQATIHSHMNFFESTKKGWSNIPVRNSHRPTHKNGYNTDPPLVPSNSDKLFLVTKNYTGAGNQNSEHLYQSQKRVGNGNPTSDNTEIQPSLLKRSLNAIGRTDQYHRAAKQARMSGEHFI